MANMNDIARKACLSVSTVSRVLNNTAPISDLTRRNVLSIAKKMGYRKRVYAGSNVRAQNIAGVIMTGH